MLLRRLLYPILEASWDKHVANQILNDPKVKQWLLKYNINNPKWVGEGGVGHAYRDGSKVIKFTIDDREAKTANKLIGKRSRSLTPIYGVMEYPDPILDIFGKNRKIFLIIQDFVNINVNADLRVAADMVGGFLDHSDISPPFKDITKVWRDCVNYQRDDEKYNDNIGILIFRILSIVQAIYRDFGLVFRDVSSSNIGLDMQGNIRFFDYGLSELDK